MATERLKLEPTLESKAGSKYALFKEMQARMFAGDKDVFKDYCTEDFRMRTPEFHFITPVEYEGWLQGEFGIETMSRYFRDDGKSFERVEVVDKNIVETEDTLIYEFIWNGINPIGSYAGFEDGERAPDLHVKMKVIEILRFRDGKIYEYDSVNDSLGYYYDMAGGDWKLAAKAIANNYDWWNNQRERIMAGEYPVDEPGKVYE